MTPRSTYAAGLIGSALLAAALTAGCSAAGPPASVGAPEAAGVHNGHHSGGHPATDHGHEGHASGGHGGHLSDGALDGLLLSERDLPAGYVAGGGHQHGDQAALAAPELAAACEPIGWLIGDHPAVVQTEHPQAQVSFAKGHYGPRITETVIDFGDPAIARAAYQRFAAAEECERYVQSTAKTGANVYRVQAVSSNGPPDGTTLRLDAVSSDFDGLHWDVWATRDGGRLVAVALRTALGGTSADLQPAIDTALEKLRSA